jgi:hypothetical protein
MERPHDVLLLSIEQSRGPTRTAHDCVDHTPFLHSHAHCFSVAVAVERESWNSMHSAPFENRGPSFAATQLPKRRIADGLQMSAVDPQMPPPSFVQAEPFEHVPQSSFPPHPSSRVPQVQPKAAHVFGVHEGELGSAFPPSLELPFCSGASASTAAATIGARDSPCSGKTTAAGGRSCSLPQAVSTMEAIASE